MKEMKLVTTGATRTILALLVRGIFEIPSRTYIYPLRQTQIYELVDCQIANLFIRKKTSLQPLETGQSIPIVSSCTLFDKVGMTLLPRKSESICRPKQKKGRRFCASLSPKKTEPRLGYLSHLFSDLRAKLLFAQ